MKTLYNRIVLSFLFALILAPALAQKTKFQNKFSKQYDFEIVAKPNTNFKEYYEITIPQALDHSDPKKTFNQRIYLGFHDFNAPTIIVTDGYAIDYASKPDFSNELAKKLKANIVVVEHRFFGKSTPDSLNYEFLTLKQASDDYHFIKTRFDKILKGKWLASGISKGGQASLAYLMYHPEDVSGVVAYGAAIKNKQTFYTDTLLSNLFQTECGKKINELQLYLFKNKSTLLPYFSSLSSQNKRDFEPLDDETVFDYLLLELPYSFWQNGNLCTDIPDTTNTVQNLVNYVCKIVPPRFFSKSNRKQLEPAFYMFYHELGYYEYNTAPFQHYLRQQNYSNKIFAPHNLAIVFDDSFQNTMKTFMQGENSANVYLIYGQNDPWALQTTANKNVFIVPSGSHKSRIADLTVEQQNEIYSKIRKCVK